jgi:probable HAF family extracellular repeat protein
MGTPGSSFPGDCPADAAADLKKVAALNALPSPRSYEVYRIAPAGQQGEARAVNARGDIAGQLNGAAFICHANQISKFPGFQYSYLDGSYSSIAVAVNDDGVAVGHDGTYMPCSMSGLEFATAVVFRDGNMAFVDRSLVGACSFEADGINDAGTIVGERGYRGFVRYADGHEVEVQPLSTRPENNGTRATALDNEGHIVGATTINVKHIKYINAGSITHAGHPLEILRAPDPDSYFIHAFLATFVNGRQQMRDLGGLPTLSDTYATAINDDLTIVGYSGSLSGPKWTRVSGPSHAWVWKHGQMTDLGSADMESTFAYGVNDAGIIVGCSGSDAVRWFHNRLEDLNDLIAPDSGWHLTCARAINRRGIIVGTGTYAGHRYPFRLVPLT